MTIGNTAINNMASVGLIGAREARRDRLTGDVGLDFSGSFKSELDKARAAQGAAVNQAGPTSPRQTIDRTSKLYEASLAMEGYFVKQMLDTMRQTVHSGLDGGDSAQNKFAQDLLYDEYATSMTKNAGFGLADQMYLQLSGKA